MKYVIYDDDDCGRKIDELDEKRLILLKENFNLEKSASLGLLNDKLKEEYGYHIKEVNGGDYKYVLIERRGCDAEHKFITLDELKDWIFNFTYIMHSTVYAWKNFEELKEYMEKTHSGVYEIKKAGKSREQLIYERLAKVKRPKKVFKVGARVIAINKVEGEYLRGMKGTVCFIKDYGDIGVDFDSELTYGVGHDCCGAGRMRHCRWGKKEEFELI